MDNLGPVDVYVSMDVNAGGKVSTNFTVADDEILDFLNDNMHLLTDRLAKRGYDLQASMKVKGEEEDSEENALDKGGVNLLLVHAGTAGSYKGSMRSFDVRA
jgi:flagellar hook-length control protein FliK